MRLVIALGGNAILQRKEPLEEAIQKKNIAAACEVIAQVAQTHQVVVTHGNGPQVGLLALQNEAYKAVSPYPLDVLGAQTEGMIGYLIAQALKNSLPSKEVAVLLTRTIVDPNDPAFKTPTKFVGPVYTKSQAQKLLAEKGWSIQPDGEYFRRVVPSPKPCAIVEEKVIQYILTMPESLLICVGGGGVPVMHNDDQKLVGLEAVVDKDRASDVLAQTIAADAFIMLTDVECVETHFNKPNTKKIKLATPDQITQYSFAKGSMAPKVEAAAAFVRSGGKFAAIGALNDLAAIVAGLKGTRLVNDCPEILYYD